MEIAFSSNKLRDMCNSEKARRKERGQREGDLLGVRLDDLHAAVTLEDMRGLPGRCHELTGDRKGQLAVDLVHPHRLVFEVANEPAPRKADKGLDWTKATAIRIIEIAQDYH